MHREQNNKKASEALARSSGSWSSKIHVHFTGKGCPQAAIAVDERFMIVTTARYCSSANVPSMHWVMVRMQVSNY